MKNGLDAIKALNDTSEPAVIKTAVSELSGFVNRYGYADSNKAFAVALNEDVTAAETFDHISLAWLDQLATLYEKKWYDPRNEIACAFGHRVRMEAIVSAEENVGSVYSNFARKMAEVHPTLQQSFTALVIAWMEERKNFNLFFTGILNVTQGCQYMPLK